MKKTIRKIGLLAILALILSCSQTQDNPLTGNNGGEGSLVIARIEAITSNDTLKGFAVTGEGFVEVMTAKIDDETMLFEYGSDSGVEVYLVSPIGEGGHAVSLAKEGATAADSLWVYRGTDGRGIEWQGTLDSAPSSPETNWAYYSSSENAAYIWDGDSWETLIEGVEGIDGTDGISIRWMGSSDTVPGSPDTNSAYYNTVDDVSYIYNGSDWDTLAAGGSDGASILWQGSSDRAPLYAQMNWAYYNTSDGISYIYNGTEWDTLALSGTDGADGSNGEDGADGSNGTNGTDGQDGTNGADGVDGLSILWQGSSDTIPSSPDTNWAYYNTADGVSYIYNGSGWDTLAVSGTDGTSGTNGSNGSDGVDGISILWQGSSAAAPLSPDTNWAYYNSVEGVSYIYDGSTWDTLAADGAEVSSLNVNGTIAPDSFLVLEHNLDRSDLTFTGQFVKNGNIYDYADYQELFSQKRFKDGTVFNEAATSNTATVLLSNGNSVVVFTDEGNSGYGTFVIYDCSGDLIKEKTVFNSASTGYISAASLNGGGFVIAYSDNGSGTFVLYDNDGNQVKTETVFNNGSTSDISVCALNDVGFVVAYSDHDNSSYGTFVIYARDGVLVKGETVFNEGVTGGTRGVSVSPFSTGGFAVAYRDQGTSSYGTFMLFDSAGNSSSSETVFNSGTTTYLSTASLGFGRMAIAYSDNGNSSYGTFVIIESTVGIIKNETVFSSSITGYILAAGLSNGNFCLTFVDYGNSAYGASVIYDNIGGCVKDKTVFNANSSSWISVAPIGGGNFITAYSDNGNSSYGTFIIYGDEYLTLERTSDNGVRLWNRTGETLEMTLSVNQ